MTRFHISYMRMEKTIGTIVRPPYHMDSVMTSRHSTRQSWSAGSTSDSSMGVVRPQQLSITFFTSKKVWL
jgi:hypothetical protein